MRLLKELLIAHGSQAMVIAKIEKPEALDQLEEIVAAADGVMVARGDLGVEIDVAEMPVVQKRIIATCHRLHKPVIVATQMLDSMQRSRRPTRAEATDVANAILDGADACMLSGETAIGEYPREAVEMMNRIALATEPLVSSDRRCRGRINCPRACCRSRSGRAWRGADRERLERQDDRGGQPQRGDGAGALEASQLCAHDRRQRFAHHRSANAIVLGRDSAARCADTRHHPSGEARESVGIEGGPALSGGSYRAGGGHRDGYGGAQCGDRA